MRHSIKLLASAIIAVPLFIGCSESDSSKSSTTPATSDALPKVTETPAPAAPTPAVTPPNPATPSLTTPSATPEQGQDAVKIVTAALAKYAAEKGKKAASLEELVQAGYLKEIPAAPAGKKLVYDPNTAELKLADQ